MSGTGVERSVSKSISYVERTSCYIFVLANYRIRFCLVVICAKLGAQCDVLYRLIGIILQFIYADGKT